MKLNFSGDIGGLEKGIEILSARLGCALESGGIPVRVERTRENILSAESDGKGCVIRHREKSRFFRALGLLVENLKREGKKPFKIEETPRFTLNTALFDCSNNAVLNIPTIKETLGTMALMGLNGLMLYTKDTYEVEGCPYFGHMRGKYTNAELRECDDHADIFGVEMIPSIQALAHLDMALKWGFAKDVKDNPDILLVGEPKTYELLRVMLKSISAPFRSKRIHLGMDEAHGLGLGRYLETNGYKNRSDIMTEHLGKVRGLCEELGLKPMIWSDMFFRLASKNHEYYDMGASIPQKVIDETPSDIDLVFWDYYHDDEETYRHFLREHKKFRNKTVFAGGVWVWKGMSPDYETTFRTTNASLAACKKEGVDEVIATLWGDNGAETNMLHGLPGMQLFAEHGFSDTVSEETLRRRFEFCAGASFDVFMSAQEIDSPNGDKSLGCASKYLLWQDVMQGLFDKNIEGKNLSRHFKETAQKAGGHLAKSGKWKWLMAFPSALADTLSEKAEIGLALRKMYLAGDKKGLEKAARVTLPALRRKMTRLRNIHRAQWMRTNKPFGWEVVEIRYGGAISRLETASVQIKEYLAGKTRRLEELEEERLPFQGSWGESASNRYHRIATASYLSGNYIQY